MKIYTSRLFYLTVILFGFLLFSAQECKDKSYTNTPKVDQDTVVQPEKTNPPEGYVEPEMDTSATGEINDPDCMGPKPEKEAIPCPDVYDPVCGCNGVNYANPCSAKQAGVKKWEKGRCE